MNSTAQSISMFDFWEEVYASCQMGKVLKWTITGVEEIDFASIKSMGLVVSKGRTKGLIPLELSNIQPAENHALTRARMRQFIGQEVPFIVIHILRDEEIFLASRLKAIEQMADATWASIKEGREYTALVRRLIKRRKGGILNALGYMAEIDGVEGFIPVNEVSYGWVNDVEDFVQTGQEMRVKVLKADRSLNKLVLSIKAAQEDPWPGCLKRYQKGGEYRGIVTGKREYGIFVALEPGVNVLCKQVKNNSPVQGDEVAVIIQSIFAENHRMTGAILHTRAERGLRRS